MYDVGEIVIGCVLIASAWALVYAVDFNNQHINKKEKKSGKHVRTK